jgi:hypothetical protein
MVKIISAEDGAELQRLFKEYPIAAARAAEALRSNGLPLEGAALQRFLEEDAKVTAIVRRIKEIQWE